VYSPVSILRRLFGEPADRGTLLPLYAAVVTEARQPVWYRDGGVPDTVDGRFDMVAAVLSLVLIRLEAADQPGRAAAALLTESFITDMDGQLREIGLGDVVVGKNVGKMMSALGGRLDAYRRTINGPEFEAALVRNVYRDVPPPSDALAVVAGRLRHFAGLLDTTDTNDLLAAKLPTP
jgi:cytochrome b pre-mRNA-processing protein 3